MALLSLSLTSCQRRAENALTHSAHWNPTPYEKNITDIRRLARSQILTALTPQHRARFGAFVAKIATTSAIGHPSAYAASIDGMLSPDEARQIVSIAVAERDAERRQMDESRSAFEGALPFVDRLNIAALRAKQSLVAPQPRPTIDPGLELLRVTIESLGSSDVRLRRD